MNILPKSHQDFSQKDYWDSFFQKRGGKAFEWYGEYPELCGHLHKYIKSKDEILNIGCGNSRLSMDLYDVGHRQIMNIDISQLVINQMISKNKTDRPDMQFLQMDACNMSFAKDKFSVVLDKGTLDALMTEDTNEVKETAEKYLSEISRVLRIGGRYVCISLLQEHIIRELVDFFPKNNWMFRVVRAVEAEQKTAESSNDGTSMPVFIVIATKFGKLPFPVLEVCMSGDKMCRVQQANEVVDATLAVQKATMVCNGLHRGSIADMDEVSMDLFQPSDQIPRFTVHILDQKLKTSNGKFAVFIVPQGRETEWIFSTPQGRKKLLLSAQYERLAIVSMHRGQIYTTWDDVKSELSASLLNLAPKGMQEQIPYLSLGSEVGNRETIYKGRSDMSGDFIVEEITGQDKKIFRRLVFLSNQFVIQSEALVTITKTKNGQRKIIDPNYLACQHHVYMTLGVNLIAYQNQKSKDHRMDVAVIGLGGGGLCMFLHSCIKKAFVTAVDIDPAMLQVATNYFGLVVDDRMDVVIEDGLKFLTKAADNGQSYKAILFDVDSKDTSLGMSCPPRVFLDKSVMDNVKKCIGEKGIFILNLVCRDDKLREQVLIELRQSFRSICAYKLDEDVNEVLYCSNDSALDGLPVWKSSFEAAAKNLNSLTKDYKISNDEVVDVIDFLKELKL
ncbi:eEF1A lysine and N-terminal methyltransferase homolog [Bradysia coprophila]|uniref:eEF1A lysine and N-terminal methyltransferase homolog n=1 Tax=Bradysia coprophila TaxID=38358 RepID=UPI00187D862A|nr:eEF1A lysine and N-terminal methyltransferase homolog [Bradysia coprophila]